MKPIAYIERFKELLPKICDRETSSDPKNWTPENPLWGHCAVVSLVAQNLFGGTLLRASLENTKYADMRSHYWNNLPICDRRNPFGIKIDFTEPQFNSGYPDISLISEPRERSYVLSNQETRRRYNILCWRLAKELNNNNPLFENAIYRTCFYEALGSPCKKMKFGALMVYQPTETLAYQFTRGCNKTIEAMKSLCEPDCIRLDIPSRTNSMIGACSHAEEGVLWEFALNTDLPTKLCNLYVAGLYPNGLPYIKSEREFTCLRCAVSAHLCGINKIFVPVIDHWEGLSTEECLKTSIAYATGKKCVI